MLLKTQDNDLGYPGMLLKINGVSRFPGMCMKTQQLRETKGIQIAATKNLDVENKGVTNAIGRLDKIGGLHRKMKVYPGMLMKTKGVKNRPQEEPGMLMKRKLVIVANRECH